MKHMTLYPMAEIGQLAWPEQPKAFSLDTPAEVFFTDFEKVQPRIIEAATSALDAKKVMMKTHVRLLIVVNDANHFLGVITADDLIERKIIQQVSLGFRREDIEVTDLMTSKKQLFALDIAAVRRSTINDVIRVLRDSHQQHCLVIDSEEPKIRGIFSATDISRKLNLHIDTENRSDFYKVFQVIA